MGAPFLVPNQTPFLMSIWASWRDSIQRRRLTGPPTMPAPMSSASR